MLKLRETGMLGMSNLKRFAFPEQQNDGSKRLDFWSKSVDETRLIGREIAPLFNRENLSSVRRNKIIKWGLAGNSGTGKTVLTDATSLAFRGFQRLSPKFTLNQFIAGTDEAAGVLRIDSSDDELPKPDVKQFIKTQGGVVMVEHPDDPLGRIKDMVDDRYHVFTLMDGEYSSERAIIMCITGDLVKTPAYDRFRKNTRHLTM